MFISHDQSGPARAGTAKDLSEVAQMNQTNILIVEDDLTTQEMARMVLENAGYSVSVARSAEEAERTLRNLWPDIVLMDRGLPGMDGLEFTRRLKGSEETSGIQVIAFSTSNSLGDCEVAIEAGSDGFVHKPFTVRGLLQTVAWHVAARAAKRPVIATPIDSSLNNVFGSFMKNSSKLLMAIALMVGSAAAANAQTTANQSVAFQVDAINQISVTGSPSLIINSATAGSGPTSATSATSTWAVTTNQSTAKITAAINTAMGTGLTLWTTLAAPTGATSAGAKSLSTTAVDVVTGITKLAQSGMTITYQLDATAAAGVITSTTRTVTYTITGGV
jgi:CheY-like chemotaxis protein